MSSQVHEQEPRGEGELPGGAGELHAARQPRPAAAAGVGLEDGEGMRLDVGVELVLHHDVDERLGPVGEHAADVVPVEAVEEVAPVLEIHRQGFRVEPVVNSLGRYRQIRQDGVFLCYSFETLGFGKLSTPFHLYLHT